MSQIRDAAYAAAQKILKRVSFGWYGEAVDCFFDGDAVKAREGFDGLSDAVCEWVDGSKWNGTNEFEFLPTTSGMTLRTRVEVGIQMDVDDSLTDGMVNVSNEALGAASAVFAGVSL